MRRHWGVLFAALFLSVVLSSCGKKTIQLQSPATGFIEKEDTGAFTLDIKPWPPKTGDLDLTVQAVDGTGLPVNDATVNIDFAMPSMAMSGPSVKLTPTGKDGVYTGKATLSIATDYQAKVTVKPAAGDAENGAFSFKIAF